MLTIPFATWIANAAAGLTGISGEVTRQAEVADWSRQTISDHARKVQAALEDAHDGGPTRATLIEQNQQLRHENAQLRDWVAQTTEFPRASSANPPSPPRRYGAEPQPSPRPADPDPRHAGRSRSFPVAPRDQNRGPGGWSGRDGPRCPVPDVGPGR